MKFQEMLKYLKECKKVKRKGWEDTLRTDKYLQMYNNCFLNDKNKPITLFLFDYEADDWEIYKEREYFDFWKAFELMKKGKKVKRDNGDKYYIYLNNGVFKNSLGYNCGMHEEDLKAIDWYLVEEE